MSICKTCKTIYEGRPNRKYCSPKCKRKAEMDARKSKRKKPVISSRKPDWPDWGDLPKWEATPEEQKAWENELANMPTWDSKKLKCFNLILS